MTTNDGPGVPPERAPETTSVFRADFLAEAEPPAPEQSVSGVDALPAGSALLVVKRGPNAGSRFLLDRTTTAPAGTPTATSSSTTSRSPAVTPSSAATRGTSWWWTSAA